MLGRSASPQPGGGPAPRDSLPVPGTVRTLLRTMVGEVFQESAAADTQSRLIALAAHQGCDSYEAASAVALLFKFVDADASGMITTEEWESAFSFIDVDHDGTISRKEWMLSQGSTVVFQLIPKRLMASVTRSEWSAAYGTLNLGEQPMAHHHLGEFQHCLRLLSTVRLEELERKLRGVALVDGQMQAGATIEVTRDFVSKDKDQRMIKSGERGIIREVGANIRIQFGRTIQTVKNMDLGKFRVVPGLASAAKTELLTEARKLLRLLGDAMLSIQAAIDLLSEAAPPSSPAGYLKKLEDLVARPSEDDNWQTEELPAMAQEFKPGNTIAATVEAYAADRRKRIAGQAKTTGLTFEEASLFGMLARNSYQAPMARALRERDPCYAGATHALSGIIARALGNAGAGAVAPKLYIGLDGIESLSRHDPAWADLEKPDATGFQGVVSSAAFLPTRSKDAIKEEGYFANINGERLLQDGPIVCIESAPPDELGGLHSALMWSRHGGVFPPNTFFKLKEVKGPPFEAETNEGKVMVQQRCLVVTATFQNPSFSISVAGSDSKMSTPVTTLQYGSRDAYVSGVQDIVAKPPLTMEEEFSRQIEWKDWKGVRYSLRECWEYVIGPAETKEHCTPGTRDVGNDGKDVEWFLSKINAHISTRRTEGRGTNLAKTYAFLTREEVLAVRLYSGPVFQPLNGFLRQLAQVQGVYRTTIGKHPALTFAATVGHLCHAIRKLAAVTTPDEARRHLFRGVRGVMPRGFWIPDEAGMVCATETAFMSTSLNDKTPIDYMGIGECTLWRLHPSPESTEAFHCGADISSLSQFAGEQEVLFPPCTMLVARRLATGEVVKTEESVNQGKTTFTGIDVVPYFV